MHFLAKKNDLTPESEGVSLQKLQEDLNELLQKRLENELAMERRMVNLEMDMRREKEKNGDLLRQYNRLELAYQTTQDRFKKLQLHIDQIGRVGDRVLLLESQLMNMQQRIKPLLSKQEQPGGSLAALEKEIMAIHRILGEQVVPSNFVVDDEELTKTYPPSEIQFTDLTPSSNLTSDIASKKPALLDLPTTPTTPLNTALGDSVSIKIDNVFFPQSSSLKPNSENEPLDNIWGQTKPSEPAKKTLAAVKAKEPIKTVVDIKTEVALSEALPKELTSQLDAWLFDRRSWSHYDWLALLKNLSELGFNLYTKPEHQGFIGRYLESHRVT